MANNWVNHVKEFSEKKKIKYTDAMKSAECKAEYEKNKPKHIEEYVKTLKIRTPMKSAECKAEYEKNKPKTPDDMKIRTPRKVKADKKEIPVETPVEIPVDVIQVKTRKAKVKK